MTQTPAPAVGYSGAGFFVAGFGFCGVYVKAVDKHCIMFYCSSEMRSCFEVSQQRVLCAAKEPACLQDRQYGPMMVMAGESRVMAIKP